MLVTVVAILAVVAVGVSVGVAIYAANQNEQRQKETELARLANVENLCALLTDVISSQQQTTGVLVQILKRQQGDVERLRDTYTKLGIDPDDVILRAERDAARLEGAQPSSLTCIDGKIRRKPPAPIPES
jgi:uncharacterized protein HemX